MDDEDLMRYSRELEEDLDRENHMYGSIIFNAMGEKRMKPREQL